MTPFVTIFIGFAVGKFVGAPISKFMTVFGSWIMWQPISAHRHGNSGGDFDGAGIDGSYFKCSYCYDA
ncbi:hypothetical protein J22TS1_40930 [Siminovitchia terrae]|nr:hypothetical protein J22TS1_40930 [Siminovitchia terrae]